MELAIQTPVQLTDYRALRELWRAADVSGVRTAFTFDHLVPLAPGARPGAAGPIPSGPQLDGWMTAQALAVETSDLEVGTLVSSVTHRPLSMLAKAVTTLHEISGGRAVLGLGVGWHAAEHEMFGLDFPPVGERMSMLEETLVALRLLFTANGPVTYEGAFVHLRDAVLEPRPAPTRPIPVLVGGSGARLRRIAARHADVYNGFWAPGEWRQVNNDLDGSLDRAGRRSTDLRRSAFVPAELSAATEVHDAFVAMQSRSRGGSAADVRGRCILGDGRGLDVLRRFHDAGVDEVVLHLDPNTDPDDLARFATAIVPEIERWERAG